MRNIVREARAGIAKTIIGVLCVIGCSYAADPKPAAEPEHAAAAGERKLFTESVVPLPAAPATTPHGLMVNAMTAEAKNETLDILFSIDIPAEKQAKLEAKLAAGETVSPEEFKKNYAPNPEDAQRLVAWLKAQDLQVTHVNTDNTGVYVRGSVTQLERALQVKMARVFKDGVTYSAARNAPSLPAEVGANVSAIIGLQPYRHAVKHAVRMPSRRPEADHLNNTLIDPLPAAVDMSGAPGYRAKHILKAYNADNLELNGKGQTIAILIDTAPNESDVKLFWKENQIPGQPDVKTINVNNSILAPPTGEETLDVEWASAIAPGAQVRVYASGSLQFSDLDLALDRIYEDLGTNPNLHQLSISLGLGETYMAEDEVKTEHRKFLKLSLAGVNIFVSSGDAGSTPDDSGHSSGGPLQAEYESSDPSVIGVGGTTLVLDANGSVSSEVAWSGSGGGISRFTFLGGRPLWQKGNGVHNVNRRLVPDVSLVADPNTGGFVVLGGRPVVYGGTSWSAPMWAGFCAMMNEARSKKGQTPITFLNPLIYPLMNTGAFRDIDQGNNGDPQFGATSGHDMVTGIGVPNVKLLIDAITR